MFLRYLGVIKLQSMKLNQFFIYNEGQPFNCSDRSMSLTVFRSAHRSMNARRELLLWLDSGLGKNMEFLRLKSLENHRTYVVYVYGDHAPAIRSDIFADAGSLGQKIRHIQV